MLKIGLSSIFSCKKGLALFKGHGSQNYHFKKNILWGNSKSRGFFID